MAYSISASIELSVPSTICSTIGSTVARRALRHGGSPIANWIHAGAWRSVHRSAPSAWLAAPERTIRIPCGSTSRMLAGKHHRGGAELLDHRRPVEPEARRQHRAVVDRRVAECAVEIDRPHGLARRRRPAARGELGQLRPLDQPEAGDAEIDQLDLLLAGIVVAEGAQMRGVEGVDQAGEERCRRPRRPGAATRTSIDWPA